MPHISLPKEYPGIRSLFMFNPVTALPLNDLVQTLLHDPATSTLTPGERELIATYTSSLNDCKYCANTHGAIAKYQLGGNGTVARDILQQNVNTADISDKLKALLHIAAKVQQGGKAVKEEDVAAAREQGATDKEIHDAVLIAAVFCMFNRYVDGLATWAPDDLSIYDAIGKQRAAGRLHDKALCRYTTHLTYNFFYALYTLKRKFTRHYRSARLPERYRPAYKRAYAHFA